MSTNIEAQQLFRISGEQLDKYVYRVISLKRLRELFQNQENVLVHPSLWEDPFENFVLKSKIRFENGEEATFGFSNSLHGQCWTRQASSDAMWRIYSSDKCGVRIRSTPRKLLASLMQAREASAPVECFIGRVEYLSDKKLIDFGNQVFKNGITPRTTSQTMFVKRHAFKHENEVRLIFADSGNSGRCDLYRYPVDPHSLIDQVMTDPRLSSVDANTIEKQIQNDTGFKGPILRSKLYALPKGMVFNAWS